MLPKQVESSLIDRVRKDGSRLLVEVLRPQDPEKRIVIIAMCEDGRVSNWYDSRTLCNDYQRLFATFGYNYDVVVHRFSFTASVEEMRNLLSIADIFCMGGINDPPNSPWRMRTQPGFPGHALVRTLKHLIQWNAIAYVGICGGAILAGRSNPYGCPPLDLFCGATLIYEGSTNPTELRQQISFGNVVWIATGMGCALRILPQSCEALAFGCVKKKSWEWRELAQYYTPQLQELFDFKCDLVSRAFVNNRDHPASNSFFSLQVFLLRGVAWEDFLPRHHRELQRRIAVENEGDFWRSVVLAGDVW